jgi:hypothetical protein
MASAPAPEDLNELSREELKGTREFIRKYLQDLFDPQAWYMEELTAASSHLRIEGNTFILPNGHRFCVKLVPEDYQPPDL